MNLYFNSFNIRSKTRLPTLLYQLEVQRKVDICHFDEAGANLIPVIPYAWQKKNQWYELPSVQSFSSVEAADSEIAMARGNEFAK